MLPKLRILKPISFATVLLLGMASTVCAETYRNPYRIPTPVDPYSVTIGDLNGDGRPDILWGDTSATPNVLHILLANSSGGFDAVASLVLPANLHTQCFIADFNQDHKGDLICSGTYQLTSWVSVFLGNGDGTFQAPITTALDNYNSGTYAYPVIFAPADLNNDGFPDIIVEDAESGSGQVRLSDGKGGFQPPLRTGVGINGAPPIVADLNGDGKPDLFFPVGPSVALGNGDGTFGGAIVYAQPSYYDATCTLHDMDGDGHLDAVCGYVETHTGDITGASDIIILHGNPDGSFNTTPISDTTFGDHDTEYDGVGTFEAPIGVADLNGDGIPDVLGASGDGLAVLLGGKGLTFQTPLHYAQPVVGYGGGIAGLFQSSLADMNADGLPDQVSCGPNGIYISYAQHDGTYISAPATEVTETIGYASVADFNGDGIPDIAATGDTAIKVSLGRGDGTFAAPVALPNSAGAINFSTPLSTMNAHILHGDFNGDGKQDLIAIGSPGIYDYNAYMLLGNGNGTFSNPLAIPNTSYTYPMYATLQDSAVVDINHDGKDDIVAVLTGAAAGPQITFQLSNGNASFTSLATTVPADPSQYSTGGFYPPTLPALADYNHDGKLDAAYGSLSNAYMVTGNGDGTFATRAAAMPIPAVSGAASLGALAAASGDFDGDGNPDFVLLVQYGTSYFPYPSPVATAAWVYFGGGNSTFSAPILAGVFNRNYTGIAAADLNLDGLSDIVLKTNGSLGGGHAVGIIHARAGRTFAAEINYTAGNGLSSLDILDINKDGYPDLLFANGDYNDRASSVTVLLNSGIPTVATYPTATTLTCLPATINLNATSQLAATVTASSGTPTGSIVFSDNGITFATDPLTAGAAAQTFPGLSQGQHTITASYSPTASSGFDSSSASCQVQVNGLPTISTLTVTQPSTAAGSNVTLTANVAPVTPIASPQPTGTVTFIYNDTLHAISVNLGTVPLSGAGIAVLNLTNIPSGSGTLTCTYSGDTVFTTSTCNTAAITIIAPAAASTLTLTSSANPASVGQPITFTLQLTSNGISAGAGQALTLTYSPTVTAPVVVPLVTDATGSATLSLPAGLPAGSYSISATFAGTSALQATSASLIEVVTTAPLADFALTGPASFSFVTSGPGATTLQLASLNGFTGNVSLTCGGNVPVYYTCALSSSSAALTPGSIAGITLTLTPVRRTAALNLPARPGEPQAPRTLITLATLLLISFAGLRRRARLLCSATSLLLLIGLAFSITACGGDSRIPGTPPGPYVLTITATGTGTTHTTGTITTTTPTHTLNITADVTIPY